MYQITILYYARNTHIGYIKNIKNNIKIYKLLINCKKL